MLPLARVPLADHLQVGQASRTGKSDRPVGQASRAGKSDRQVGQMGPNVLWLLNQSALVQSNFLEWPGHIDRNLGKSKFSVE
jgi:hypothetical protein